MPPRVERALVLNAGSSTLKWSVLEAAGERLVGEGSIDWQGLPPAGQAERVRAMLRATPAASSVAAAGHRVVHGGGKFRGAVRVTPEVRRDLAALTEIDPLHTPAALAGIDAVAAEAPELPQVAAFDTSFHATLSEAAALYPLPWEWSERHGLRRYGFHGLSVSYAAGRVAELLGGAPRRLLVCHLGSGCSLTAVADGRSVDTTMGMTPLEGVMMATRCGSVDPGLLLHLQRRCGLGLDELEEGLQHGSGLAGVSGASGDLRQVLAAAAAGSRRAALAYDVFVHSLVRHAGAMIAVLGGLDALVLTGGIGEHSARLRADLLARLAFAGASLDAAANTAAAGDRELSPAGAAVRVFTLAAREDLAILRELLAVLAA
jgi:acetate kinase